MKPIHLISALALALSLAACGGESGGDDHANEAAGEHAAEESGEHAEAEAATGEHGGRLLQQDGYTVELAMAEDGTPPRFQAWLYEDGEPLPATAGKVKVRVTRLGGETTSYTLTPQEDGSLGAADTVAEPHSFEVERLQDDVLPRLTKAEAATRTAYRAGAASYLEWATLQAERTAARKQQLEAALDAQRALIEIQRLTGQAFVAGPESNTEQGVSP